VPEWNKPQEQAELPQPAITPEVKPKVEEVKAPVVVVEEKKDTPVVIPEQKLTQIKAAEPIEVKKDIENPIKEAKTASEP
jgi:hypothetical protein